MYVRKIGLHYCLETVRKLMKKLRLQPTMFNNRCMKKYSSYKGKVGKTHPNILSQSFKATMPYQILHTDITQLKIKNHTNGYISAVIDEGTKEILSIQVSSSPNQQLVYRTLKDLKNKIPTEFSPIIHSDQGWHYQLPYYTSELKKMNFKQSMSFR